MAGHGTPAAQRGGLLQTMPGAGSLINRIQRAYPHALHRKKKTAEAVFFLFMDHITGRSH
jgi:hypothetical protein